VSIQKLLGRSLLRATVSGLHFHDLRHTFTTTLPGLGIDYEVRQALLGHKMPGMTASHSHGRAEWDKKLRQAVTKLEKAYSASYSLSYERTTWMVALQSNDMVSRPGLEPGTLALKDRKDGFTQRLGFANVSPFFFGNTYLR